MSLPIFLSATPSTPQRYINKIKQIDNNNNNNQNLANQITPNEFNEILWTSTSNRYNNNIRSASPNRSLKFVNMKNESYDSNECHTSKMKVIVRIRQSTQRNITHIHVENSKTIRLAHLNNSKLYFDHVFSQNTKQNDVYRHSVWPLFSRFIKGENTAIFSYGSSGAGKTYTLGMCNDLLEQEPENLGIIPRVANDLFKYIDNSQYQNNNVDNTNIEANNDNKVIIKCSYLEIRGDFVKDLLRSSKKSNNKVIIREHSNGSIHLRGVKEYTTKSYEDIMKYLHRGSNRRQQASHCIFTLTLCKNNKTSSFHFADMAGSECKDIGVNQGLLALDNVIKALSRGTNEHIPYREAPLTRLLQNVLGGDCYTTMLVCVYNDDIHNEDTTSILHAAEMARNVKNYHGTSKLSTVKRPATAIYGRNKQKFVSPAKLSSKKNKSTSTKNKKLIRRPLTAAPRLRSVDDSSNQILNMKAEHKDKELTTLIDSNDDSKITNEMMNNEDESFVCTDSLQTSPMIKENVMKKKVIPTPVTDSHPALAPRIHSSISKPVPISKIGKSNALPKNGNVKKNNEMDEHVLNKDNAPIVVDEDIVKHLKWYNNARNIIQELGELESTRNKLKQRVIDLRGRYQNIMKIDITSPIINKNKTLCDELIQAMRENQKEYEQVNVNINTKRQEFIELSNIKNMKKTDQIYNKFVDSDKSKEKENFVNKDDTLLMENDNFNFQYIHLRDELNRVKKDAQFDREMLNQKTSEYNNLSLQLKETEIENIALRHQRDVLTQVLQNFDIPKDQKTSVKRNLFGKAMDDNMITSTTSSSSSSSIYYDKEIKHLRLQLDMKNKLLTDLKNENIRYKESLDRLQEEMDDIKYIKEPSNTSTYWNQLVNESYQIQELRQQLDTQTRRLKGLEAEHTALKQNQYKNYSSMYDESNIVRRLSFDSVDSDSDDVILSQFTSNDDMESPTDYIDVTDMNDLNSEYVNHDEFITDKNIDHNGNKTNDDVKVLELKMKVEQEALNRQMLMLRRKKKLLLEKSQLNNHDKQMINLFDAQIKEVNQEFSSNQSSEIMNKNENRLYKAAPPNMNFKEKLRLLKSKV